MSSPVSPESQGHPLLLKPLEEAPAVEHSDKKWQQQMQRYADRPYTDLQTQQTGMSRTGEKPRSASVSTDLAFMACAHRDHCSCVLQPSSTSEQILLWEWREDG